MKVSTTLLRLTTVRAFAAGAVWRLYFSRLEQNIETKVFTRREIPGQLEIYFQVWKWNLYIFVEP